MNARDSWVRIGRNILESLVRIQDTSVKWPDGTSSWLITVESYVYVREYIIYRYRYLYIYIFCIRRPNAE